MFVNLFSLQIFFGLNNDCTDLSFQGQSELHDAELMPDLSVMVNQTAHFLSVFLSFHLRLGYVSQTSPASVLLWSLTSLH